MLHFQPSLLFASAVASISIYSTLVSAACVDSPLYAIVDNHNKGVKERTCRWIKSKAPTDMCGDASFASHCPLSCQKCHTYRCADSEASFVHKGTERSCEWLSHLNDTNRIDWLCGKERVRNTCRQTCGFCLNEDGNENGNGNGIGNHIINFDEVEVYDYMDYSTDYIITDYMAAFRGQYFNDYLGFDAITIFNNYTAGGNRYDDKPAVFSCPQGTFDMYSMYLAPLFGDGGGNITTVQISAFDETFKFVGETEIELVDTSDMEATRVSLPSSFKDLRVVTVWGGLGNYYGFNNIELYIHSECGTYYNDDSSTDAMSGLLNKYTSALAKSGGDTLSVNSNAWENLSMMTDDLSLLE